MITKEQLKKDLQRRYNENKLKIKGSECICPICHETFVKKTPFQAFCTDVKGQEYSCRGVYHNFTRFGTIYKNCLPFKELYRPNVLTETKKVDAKEIEENNIDDELFI